MCKNKLHFESSFSSTVVVWIEKQENSFDTFLKEYIMNLWCAALAF